MKQRDQEKIVIYVASLGMFLSTLDSGIINVALPTLQNTFKVSIPYISWTISVYFLVLTSTVIFFGKLSDRYGRLTIFHYGMVIFALASLLCAIANSAATLIALRAFQAVGAAMMQATAIAIITTLISESRQGHALGMLGVNMAMGPILGPTVGGLLLSTLGWRSIFWINLPLCLFGLLGAKKIDDRSSYASSSLKLFIPISLFHRRDFCLALMGALSFGIAIASVLMIPPFLLQNIAHLLPWQVGLISFCAPFGIILTAKVSGKYITKTRAKIFMVIGLLVMLLALIGLAMIRPNTSVWYFVPCLLLYGIGGGFFQPSNMFAIMQDVEYAYHGTVSAFIRMLHNFGNALGVGVASALLQMSSLTFDVNAPSQFLSVWMFAIFFISLSLVSFILQKPPIKLLSQSNNIDNIRE